jgi:DNA repair protein RecO (recombination protein O)
VQAAFPSTSISVEAHVVTETALALVVRGTDWSETSRISTLFTREFGKVRALAKGGRRLKSNFEIAFDLLTVCRVAFIRKSHGGLDLLTEAQVVERFPHLRTDLHALNVGYYIAELLSDGTQDYDPHPDLFDAAVGTLRGLGAKPPPPGPPSLGGKGEQTLSTPFSPKEGGGGGRSSPESVSIFELVWLRELGYSPRLDACAVCARGLPVPLPEPIRVSYSPEAGGVVCPDCSSAARDRRPLSEPARLALIGLSGGTSDPRERLVLLTPPTKAEVRAALGQTVSYVLGRRPRLLGYVDGG